MFELKKQLVITYEAIKLLLLYCIFVPFGCIYKLFHEYCICELSVMFCNHTSDIGIFVIASFIKIKSTLQSKTELHAYLVQFSEHSI